MIKIRVIIAGSRKFNDYQLLEKKMNKLLANYKPEEIEIISGGAFGADCWGEYYAGERGIKKRVFLADWNTYGRSAGPRRNEEMAKYGTHCAVFWDGMSYGTRNNDRYG
jgi:hypothetical protein